MQLPDGLHMARIVSLAGKRAVMLTDVLFFFHFVCVAEINKNV